jgi:hypothetical protein
LRDLLEELATPPAVITWTVGILALLVFHVKYGRMNERIIQLTDSSAAIVLAVLQQNEQEK